MNNASNKCLHIFLDWRFIITHFAYLANSECFNWHFIDESISSAFILLLKLILLRNINRDANIFSNSKSIFFYHSLNQFSWILLKFMLKNGLICVIET